MWVLTTKGAVSIVKFNHAPEGDPRTMQVRSRRKEWLQPFAELVGREGIELIHSDDKDYQWRFFATPEEVARAVARAALDISYSNFKNATDSPQHGLKNPKLRHSLHDAYSKIWSTLLSAGDGTSMYNGSWKSTTSYGAGTIDICARLGHWWKGTAGPCDDCGTPNPNAPAAGPEGLKPSKRQVTAWWKAHGGRSNKPKLVEEYNKRKGHGTSKAVSAGSVSTSTGTAWQHKSPVAQPVGGGTSPSCTGSWLHAAKSSLDVDKGVATGECTVCGQRIPLTLDTWVIRLHDKPVVLGPPEAIVDDDYGIPEPAKSIEQLEAEKDAAKDNYYDTEDAHGLGQATDDELDEAIRLYCEAEDAYLEAMGQKYGQDVLKEGA